VCSFLLLLAFVANYSFLAVLSVSQCEEIASYYPHVHLVMWHFTNTSVLRCFCVIGSSVTKSVWQFPVMYRQLQSCNFVVRKPCLRSMFGRIYSLGQFSHANALRMFTGQSAGLLNLCTACAKRSGCMKYLQPQLRRASNAKAFQSVVTSPVQQASKRATPKVSEVYRLLSLAKPEKWKLLGENPVYFVVILFDIN